MSRDYPMFEYTIVHWTTFITTAVLLNLSPGPDMAFILGQTASNGRKGGFSAMFGIWTGAFIHVVMAAIGLSAILATSALAFSVVKWIGAAYLVYLGVQALLSKDASFLSNGKSSETKMFSIYKQGVLVASLNPKVAIFFLAFLPQFVVEGAGSNSAQLFLHGILIIVVAALIEPPLVLAGAKLVSHLKDNRRIGVWLDKGLGALFVTLGIRLAISER